MIKKKPQIQKANREIIYKKREKCSVKKEIFIKFVKKVKKKNCELSKKPKIIFPCYSMDLKITFRQPLSASISVSFNNEKLIDIDIRRLY